ncbi:MAG: hypothetical protein ACFFCI_02210 [Promethearchaeota archaeon]
MPTKIINFRDDDEVVDEVIRLVKIAEGLVAQGSRKQEELESKSDCLRDALRDYKTRLEAFIQNGEPMKEVD